jgi:hypothetical protein
MIGKRLTKQQLTFRIAYKVLAQISQREERGLPRIVYPSLTPNNMIQNSNILLQFQDYSLQHPIPCFKLF